MGRPREHDERTAAALLAAAERAVEEGGPEALSVRGIAAEVGTTTRAVYSLFGSKDGLIAALGVQAFEFLRTELGALPLTGDPAADLVETGLVFRRLAIERPALYSIGVQRDLPAGSPRGSPCATPPMRRSTCSCSTWRGSATRACWAIRTSWRPRSSSTPSARGSPRSSGAAGGRRSTPSGSGAPAFAP